MAKQKIVYIAEAFGGGVLTYLSELASGLVSNYDISILYGRRAQTPNNLSDYFPSQVHLYEIKNFTRELNPYKDFCAYLELKSHLKKINPDIVHLNSSKAGALGRLIKYQKNQKIFYTPHGYSFLMDNQSTVKSRLYLGIEKILGQLPAYTIAVGKEEYKQSLRVTRKSTYINNGVDTHLIDGITPNDSIDSDYIVTVGRIDTQKNPKFFNQLALSCPQRKFLWIGDGPLKSELVAPNIKISGWMSHNQVLAILKQTQIFLLLSRWEGLPISLLEAMYCRNLCIVSNVVGNRDVIKNGETGIIVDDLENLLRAINKGIIEFKNIIDKAENEILYEYNLKQMIIKYQHEYEN
ncbi:glycosyltransferase [Bombilactobacillus bombi]|nr:glycosyltransferase [Bombilactobacillus bombi]